MSSSDGRSATWRAVFDAVVEWDGQIDEIRRDDFVDRILALTQPAEAITVSAGQARRLIALINWVHGSGELPSPRFTDEEMLELVRTLRPTS